MTPPLDTTAFDEAVAALEPAAGITAFVHALDLDTGAQCGVRPDHRVVAASVFKTPVLAEACRQMANGQIDPRLPVTIAADHKAGIGATGISAMSDDITMSFQDLCLIMMTVSDNRATDIVMEHIGLRQINDLLTRLGLTQTVVEGDCEYLLGAIAEEVGLDPQGDWEVTEADRSRVEAAPTLGPDHGNRTTARESTDLLRRLWRADQLPEEACQRARSIMAQQVWPHRLSSGFPEAGVKVAAKTGTVIGVRNEAGVVTWPDGRQYAVAVFLRHHALSGRLPEVDAAIGTLGRAAVDTLRGAADARDA